MKHQNQPACTQLESLSALQDENFNKINEILQKIEKLSQSVDTFIGQVSGCDVFKIQEEFNESK